MKWMNVRYNIITVLFWMILSQSVVFAQQSDSIAFVNTKWDVTKISRGVKLYTHHFNAHNLFNANEYISFLVVKNKKRKNRFYVAAEKKELRTVSDFSTGTKATGAVNGNFFDIKNGGSEDYVKINHEILSKNNVKENGLLSFHQKSAIAIRKGKLLILKGTDAPNWPDSAMAETVMANGPLLFMNHVPEPDSLGAFYTARHPRTAVGLKGKKEVIMLVVDGRQQNSAGMTIREMATIMRWLGCYSAINFDGGGSSTLWVKQKGVINHPTDNKKWDHEGQRKVANALYFK